MGGRNDLLLVNSAPSLCLITVTCSVISFARSAARKSMRINDDCGIQSSSRGPRGTTKGRPAGRPAHGRRHAHVLRRRAPGSYADEPALVPRRKSGGDCLDSRQTSGGAAREPMRLRLIQEAESRR
jgi:hypothetical protein